MRICLGNSIWIIIVLAQYTVLQTVRHRFIYQSSCCYTIPAIISFYLSAKTKLHVSNLHL